MGRRFNLIAAQEDLVKRQQIFGATKGTLDGIYGKIQSDYACMTQTLPEDKKDFVKKEINAVTDKLEVLARFKEKVDKIDEFVTELKNFDVTLKEIDAWMAGADKELDTIKTASDKMTPEDRVSYTMELTEDVEAKVDSIKKCVAAEAALLPQGDTVPQDAQDYKTELRRIQDYVVDLHKRVMATCDSFSEDVKFWAEYKTGIRGFNPWLKAAEKTSSGGLSKPQTLDEANAMFAVCKDFEAGCLKHLKILDDAAQASLKMTTHKEADDEVVALRERYAKVKSISDDGWQNATPWLRNGNCLITQSQNSTPGWLQIVEQKANKTSLWKRWSPLWENSKTSSKRRRSLSIIFKFILQIFYHQTNLHIDNNKIGHLVGIHHIKNICNL